jgi:hypothetical protein
MTKIRDFCESIPEGSVRDLDNDTAVSHSSFAACIIDDIDDYITLHNYTCTHEQFIICPCIIIDVYVW